MASWTKRTVTDWGCPYGWAAFRSSVTRVAPVPHGCPAPRPALWRECPLPPPPVRAEKTKSECNVNHKVITHASTRISMSFGDAAPWMYLVSKSRGTHRGREKATHKWKKTGFLKRKNTFLHQIYIETKREKDLKTAAQLSGCVTFSLIALIFLCGGRQISLHVICICCQAEFNIL